MLNRKQKEEIIDQLSDGVSKSKAVVLCDYKGLTVAEIREIRNALRAKDAKMQVVKKTLATLALKKSGAELDAKKLEGQVAVIYGGQDEISAAKALFDYSKKNDKLRIVAGLLESKPLSPEEVISLAKLPSKEEMLARLVGTINAPVSGFVNVLAGNLRNLVGVLNAIKEVK